MPRPHVSIQSTDVELFNRATDRRMPLVTCRFCERRGPAIADGITLCQDCVSQGDVALREHLRITVDGYSAALTIAWEALAQAIEDAEPTIRARWNTFQDAVTNHRPEAVQAEHKARAGAVGPLSNLLRLWCAYRDAQGIYEERRQWADRAELVIALWNDED